jgi:arsenate reductase-like glutaredoxin family protein
MNIQVFGRKSDFDTQKALRFFKERRIQVHFMDFKVRGPSKGELRRFFQKFGADAVIDRDAKRFRSLGLHTAHYGDDRWMEIAEEEPGILRTPLVRNGNELTVGHQEDTWKEWVEG